MQGLQPISRATFGTLETVFQMRRIRTPARMGSCSTIYQSDRNGGVQGLRLDREVV